MSSCNISLSKSSCVYNGSARKPSVTVKYGSSKLTNGTDYTVSYSDNKSVGTATVTITGLKKTTTYYVRIRTYKTVDGKKYYFSWSSIKKIKTQN
ncbi:MAG: hypothetical protein LUI07_09125 [Lachnospiraceae bacterium]|nr:hypothetical protein [Lachnospiraceae bacterium]